MADAHKNEEIAWAAGLFEGEGCIVVDSTGNRGRPRVQVVLGTTDRDVLERFQAIVGRGSITTRPSKSERHRELYVWMTHGRGAIPILEMLLPWLGERRRERAIHALELAEQLSTRLSKSWVREVAHGR